MAKNLSSILRGTNYGTLPISSGGTGATSAAAALAALGAQAALVSGTNIKTVNGTTLLGSGDLVVTGGASATKTIVNKTAAYTVVAGDLGKIINCTSGTFTVSLTAAATLGAGFTCTIWNTSNTAADAITINPNAAETIDGKTTLILRRGEGLDIVCDGTNWQIDNNKPMRNYAENSDYANRASASGDGAVAIGGNASASGAAAFSFGGGAISSGNYSLSLGLNTTVTGARSVGIGNNTVVVGADYSTAIGNNSGFYGSVTATGSGAMALGGSYASGTDSFAAAIANNTSTYGALGLQSIAMGYHAKASNNDSVAIGNNAIATGDSGFAIGKAANATGANSYAGSFATASGSASIAFCGVAASNNSVAIGYNSAGTKATTATGAGAMALGGSYASGADSFAAGIANNTSTYGATVANTIAIGLNSKASGAYSISIGAVGLASGDSSVALGSSVTATGVNSVVLGNNAVATQNGKYTFANGRFLANGDAQFGKIILRAQNSSTPTILTSDGAAASTNNQLIIATGQSMVIQGTLIAKQSGSGNITAYNITGAVSNNGGTLSSTGLALTLIGTDSIGLGAAPTIALDTVNKAVKITSGWTGSQTRYVATLNTTEVTFA